MSVFNQAEACKGADVNGIEAAELMRAMLGVL
jgi:hypothetical protein